MARVYGYIRVSTDHQDLQRQKVLIQKYCKEHEHTLLDFIGEKVTGTKVDRSGVKEVFQLTKKDADIVIISELSRLSREDDILNVMSEINSIRMNGLDLYILDTDTWIRASDTIGGMKVMQLVFTAEGNATERRKIADRMKTGRYTKLLKNHYAYIGGQIPFGFKVVTNENYDETAKNDKEPKSVLVVNTDEKKILETMYRKIASGYTLHRLAKEMIDDGIIITKGSLTNYQALISKILSNRLYIGERIYKGEIFPISPLIHKSDFDAAAAALKKNRWVVSYSSNFNPLKGILYCTCGRSMYYTNCKDYRYYKCYKKKDDANNQICSNMGVKAETVFRAIWMAAKDMIANEEFKAKTSERKTQLKREHDIASNAFDDYTLEIVKKKKSLEGFVKKIAELENTNLIKALEKQYENTEKEIEEIKKKKQKAFMTTISILNKFRELEKIEDEERIDSLSTEYKSELLHKFIDKAIWCSDRLRKGYLQINYINGLVETLLIQTDKTHSIILRFPTDIQLDLTQRKVKIEDSFYSVEELIKKFDYSGWKLEETIVDGFKHRSQKVIVLDPINMDE